MLLPYHIVMKIWKISVISIFLVIALLFGNLFVIQSCSAEGESYRVCTDVCSIFIEPNSSLGNENILQTKNYGEVININSTEIADLNSQSNLKYFEVLEGSNVIGYVLSSTVVKASSSELKVNFQSNAKLNSISDVYELFGNSYNLMEYKNSTIKLEKNTEIKILNGYDKHTEYTQDANRINIQVNEKENVQVYLN